MHATQTVLGAAFFREPCSARTAGAGRDASWRKRGLARVCGICALVVAALACAQEASTRTRFEVVGDGIPQPLTRTPGNAERGRALLVERAAANCLLCHAVPDPSQRVAGNVGPSLAGVGRRLSAAQLRLRIADIQRLNPDAVMPSYYRVDELDRVAGEYRGKPVLDGQQVEDLVAYLETLK